MKVKVNSTYRGEGWYDPKSGIHFKKSSGTIEIPKEASLVNINRYLRLNYLIKEEDEATDLVEDQLVTLTPAQLLIEEKVESLATEEETHAPEEEAVEEPEVEESEKIDEFVESEDGKVACEFCGKEYSPRGLAVHQRSCKENPENK